MDSHRQHEYISNNEDRSRSIYCNVREVEDVVPQAQYFTQGRAAESSGNKMCGCPADIGNNSNCKDCNTISSVEKSWTTQNQLNVDYSKIEAGKNPNESNLYVHSETNAGPYWSGKFSSFAEEPLMANKSLLISSPNIDRRPYGKICNPETAAYKMMPQLPLQQQQPQSQLRPQLNASFCKGQFCDDKYLFKHEDRALKMMYPSQSSILSSCVGSCDSETNRTSTEALRRTTIDNRLINPNSNQNNTNIEQLHSSNYTRKCPQICTLDNQGSNYTNLYMSAPQFSSDKFASIQPEKNFDFLSRVNTEVRHRDDVAKLCESPLRPKASPFPTGYSVQNIYSPVIKEQVNQHMQQQLPHTNLRPHKQQQYHQSQPLLPQHASFSRIPTTPERSVHYIPSQSTSKDYSGTGLHANTSPQVYDHHQYSRNAKSFPTTNLTPMKTIPRITSELISKGEQSLDSRGAGSNRSGLYMNPYNVPPMLSATCCKDSSPPSSVISNLRRESPHDTSKYVKAFVEPKTVQKMSSASPQYATVSVPATTSSSSFTENSAQNFRPKNHYYESVHPKCLKKPSYNPASSSILAANRVSALPQSQPHLPPPAPPQFLSTSHQKTHHRQYSPQYVQSYPQTYHQYEERQPPLQIGGHKISNSAAMSDAYDNRSQPSIQMPCYVASRTPQTSSNTALSTPTIGGLGNDTGGSGVSSTIIHTAHSKKSQAPKPNYRELIKQVHAIRSAEDELNLQIIKKTMNVDARLNTTPEETMHSVKSHSWTQAITTESMNHQSNFATPSSTCRTDMITNLSRTDHSAMNLRTIIPNALMASEKTPSSPLDLSMRTVKTKADSTDYRYQRLVSNSQITNTSAKYSYTLPRMEFTPNFSLHTEDTKSYLSQSNNVETSRIVEPLARVQEDGVYLSDDITKRISLVKSNLEASVYRKSGSNETSFKSPFSFNPNRSCTPEIKTAISLYETPSTFTRCNELIEAPSTKAIINSFSPVSAKRSMRGCQEIGQVRPSVLETNPYAASKGFNKDQIRTRTLPSINQLPPETSVLPLVKLLTAADTINAKCASADPLCTSQSPEQTYNDATKYEPVNLIPVSAPNFTVTSSVVCSSEQNSNALGKKRHLLDNETNVSNKQAIKQPKLEGQISSAIVEMKRLIEVPVIAINEKVAVEPIQNQIFTVKHRQNTDAVTLTGKVTVFCKEEPMSPTQSVHPTFATSDIKNDTNSLIAARIRTKAELKGFTFSPPIAKNNASPPLEPTVHIKEEPSQVAAGLLPSIPELNDNCYPESLLDFGWNKTCNNFVEQLLSNPKTAVVKKRSRTIRTEQSDENLTSSENGREMQNIKLEDEKGVGNKTDKQKCTHRLTNLKNSIGYQFNLQDTNMHSMNSIPHDVRIVPPSVVQKKISKVGRDKLRVQQQRRFAARIQDGSSSESDNELDRRKTERLKKPFKKVAKLRSSSNTTKNRFSDCGSDSSGSGFNKSSKGQQTSTNIGTGVTKHDYPMVQSAKSSNPGHQHLDDSIETGLKTSEMGIHNNKKALSAESKIIKRQNNSSKEFNNKSCKKNDAKLNFAVTVKLEKIPNCGQEKSISANNVPTEGENMNSKKLMGLNHFNKQKAFQKVGQNTITRSKQKRELELQLANSKVLRNDKVIRNSTATDKIKRKYTRKFTSTHSLNNVKKEPLKKDMENQLIMSTRLRSRKDQGNSNERKTQKQSKANHQVRTKDDSTKLSIYPANRNDGQSDILMEVYRYKRSLKIPPSLITIKDPRNNRSTDALSDLETETNCKNQRQNVHPLSISVPKTQVKLVEKERKSKQVSLKGIDFKNQKQITVPVSKEPPATEQPRSIIDVLHSRVLKSTATNNSKVKQIKYSGKKVCPSTKVSQKLGNLDNVPSIASAVCTAASTAELPSLKTDDVNYDDSKKRHFSIFDTKVLQTKTRTESKLQQRREIIREIFVGDERPASAPPEISPAIEADSVKMTYEQKYEQFLQQMNIVVNGTKFCKFGQSSSNYNVCSQNNEFCNLVETTTKQEEDTESASAIDVDIPADNVSITSMGPIQRRRKNGKYFRRKGSSGFDYIRKKKKPSSICSAASQHLYITHRSYTKSEAAFKVKAKTEDDVCREIQKWVLNKGVGQSTMHKAARLGYIDVIVYCLDRLCMNPDQKDNAGYTPLHEACTNGWIEIAKILLQYGAKHSEAAHSGIRPLHEASENDHEEIVRLLLSYGADPLLSTYSGQTPLMLASNTAVRNLLKDHLRDVQYVGPDRKPWEFEGPWKMLDANECGYDVLSGAPNNICDMSKALSRSLGTNLTLNKKQCNQYDGMDLKAISDKSPDILNNICNLNSIRLFNNDKPEIHLDGNSDGDGELFEFEEADVLLPPLYLIKDEGAQKWVLLSDLCNLLKVKSKDTLLNKIYPSSSVSSSHKGFIREFKMSDFLEKATCLQLLCAGEKINICASKVVLIKYNENVRNLLGVKTIVMKF